MLSIGQNLIKIGIASIDTHVGNMTGNLLKHLEIATQMHKDGVTIGVFPEQGFGGYPSEDAAQFQTFVRAQLSTYLTFVNNTRDLSTIYVVGVIIPHKGNLYNCAAVVYRGVTYGFVPKEKLPNYGIFHEWRIYSPGYPGMLEHIRPFPWVYDEAKIPFGDLVFDFHFGTLAVEICEDIWSPDGPMSRRGFESSIVANISASPWRGGVMGTREQMIPTRASDRKVIVAYTNQVGGQDADVFDGGGFITQCGRPVIEGKRWAEGFSTAVVDLDETDRFRREDTTWRTDYTDFKKGNTPKPHHVEILDWRPNGEDKLVLPRPESDNPFLPSPKVSIPADVERFEEIMMAMQTGLAGYFEKTGAFKRIGIALSGGNDSYLTLLVAWRYAESKFKDLPDQERKVKIKDFIHCLSMPTEFNSDTTKSIARMVCEELGVSYHESSIQKAYEQEVQVQKELLGVDTLPQLTLQNIQPRIRSMRMWNWTGQIDALFLHTGNMTENAVGYTTIGGDLEGGYSLIGNLPKGSIILPLLKYLYTKYPLESLKMLLESVASAELMADQEDERDIQTPFIQMEYEMYMLVVQKKGPLAIYQTLRGMYSDDDLLIRAPWYKPGDLKEWVKFFVKRFFRMEYKRVQMPQAVHMGSLDLDRERALHLPVVMSLDWLQDEFDEMDKLP